MSLILRKTLAGMMILLIAFAIGCGGTKTVFVNDGTPIRIGPDTRGRVYYLDPDTGIWTLGVNKVRIPEGWYCVSPEDVEE